eukprot:m.30319 g.30319  ORF g.30319 m.30319 type:complete len:635 (-) comp8192_c0_seq1:150-2054(-)
MAPTGTKPLQYLHLSLQTVFLLSSIGHYRVSLAQAEDQVGTPPKDLNLLPGYNYDRYEPGKSVEKYRRNDFPEDFEDSEALQTYGVKVGTRGAIILGVGIIIIIYLSIWSCAMLNCCVKRNCCCAVCCGEPMSFFSRKNVKSFIWFLVLCLSIGAIIVGSYGMSNERTQDEEFKKLGRIIDVLVDWVDQADNQLAISLRAVGRVSNATHDLLNVQLETSEIQSSVTENSQQVIDILDDVVKEVQTIEDEINDIKEDLEDSSDDFEREIDRFNDPRHRAVTITYAALLSITITYVIIMLLKEWQPKLCAHNMRCIQGLYTFLYLLIIFLLFVVCAVMLIVLTVTSDFCYDFDNNLLNAVGADVNEDIPYFVKCDVTPAPPENPFNDDLSEIMEFLDNSTKEIQEIANTVSTTLSDANQTLEQEITLAENNGLNASEQPGVIDARDQLGKAQRDEQLIQDKLDGLTASLDLLSVSLGTGLTAQGFQEGLFSSLHCYSLNLRYQAVVNIICTDLHKPLALSYEYILTLVIMMILVDVFRRLIRPTSAQRGVVPTNSPTKSPQRVCVTPVTDQNQNDTQGLLPEEHEMQPLPTKQSSTETQPLPSAPPPAYDAHGNNEDAKNTTYVVEHDNDIGDSNV